MENGGMHTSIGEEPTTVAVHKWRKDIVAHNSQYFNMKVFFRENVGNLTIY